MSPNEFQAWMAGFCEALDYAPPTAAQCALIRRTAAGVSPPTGAIVAAARKLGLISEAFKTLGEAGGSPGSPGILSGVITKPFGAPPPVGPEPQAAPSSAPGVPLDALRQRAASLTGRAPA